MAAEIIWAPVSRWAPDWRHVWLLEPELHLLVCTQRRDDKIVITHVIVAGDSLDSNDIIAVPMGRIAQLMAITPPVDPPEPSPEPMQPGEDPTAWLQRRAAYAQQQADEDTDDVRVATSSIYSRSDRAMLVDVLGVLPAYVPRPAPDSEPWTVPAEREPLTRPEPGPGYDPDEFYRRVAEAYTAHILRTSRVAPAIAEEAGVPVTTVRGWIREARRRGHLEPEQPRKP